MSKIGIIAGGGKLPELLASVCALQNNPAFIIALEGHANSAWLDSYDYSWKRMGAAGDILDTLRAQKVEKIVMAGHVKRPSLLEIRPDWKGTQILAKLGLATLGDDGLLKSVAKILEDEGFKVIGADDILSDLRMSEGVLTQTQPIGFEEDILQGMVAAKDLGAKDLGQSVIIEQGTILGLEDESGTNALIERCAVLQKHSKKAILVKCAKPQQDRRFDLPTIGLGTIEKAIEYGLAGIVAEANKSLFLDRKKAIALADENGIFIVGKEWQK